MHKKKKENKKLPLIYYLFLKTNISLHTKMIIVNMLLLSFILNFPKILQILFYILVNVNKSRRHEDEFKLI